MVRSLVLIGCLAGTLQAQEPFTPLKLEAAFGAPSRDGVRADWVRITNQRLEMGGKTVRVAQAGDGLTAVVLAPGVQKPRHAKPILTGKGDYELLFKSAVNAGFTRILVRNPDTGQEWGARLEQGRAILD